MTVAHLFWALSYGGIETMLVNIANEQQRQGAEVYVIIINNLIADELAEKISPEVKLVKINRPVGSKSLAFIPRLNRALSIINPDIIHLHGSKLYDFLYRRWYQGGACRVCSTLHAMPYGVLGSSLRVIRIVQDLICHQGGNVININRINKVFSISNIVAESLKSNYGVDSTVVYNGIQTRLFEQRDVVMCGDVIRIVQVSRLHYEKKGQDLLIEAAGRLAKKGFGFKIDFIGDGESKSYLESLSLKLGLKDKVKFLGAMPQDYLIKHLKDYDLFVQPSRYEGFGLTVAEAMSANVPVLVSSGQGPAEVTEGERYGWVFERNSVDDLTARLEHVFTHYDLCLDKVEMARKHVMSNYDVTVTARRYLEMYRNILEEDAKN